MSREARTLSAGAEGRFTFDAPDSRAVLFHFRRNDEERGGQIGRAMD
jgi:hypothetical protein